MTVIRSGLVSTFDHDLAALFGQIYSTNGWDRVQVWDGYSDSAVAAGIPPPTTIAWAPVLTSSLVASAQTSGWVDIGVHLLRYRYANSRTQYPGNPTNAATLNAKARKSAVAGTGAIYKLNGFLKSTDPKVDRIIVEATDAGGATFYQATVLANSAWGSVAFRTRDKDLRANPLFWDGFGHDRPPYFSIVEPFRGRLWGIGQNVYEEGTARQRSNTVAVSGTGVTWTTAAVGRFFIFSGKARRFVASVLGAKYLKLESNLGASVSLRAYKIVSEVPDVLRFSKALYPESWPVENSIRVLDGKPEKAKAVKGFRQDLVIFGERSMERLVFSENPFLDGGLEPVQGERGAASRRVVLDVHGSLYALDYKGIHKYDGGTPTHISERIDTLFDPGDRTQGYVDFEYRGTFHAVHYANRHQILWFVVLNGDPDDDTVYTLPHHAIVYDYEADLWSIHKFDTGVVASCTAPGADGTTQTLIADENGRIWSFGIGDTDGAHTSYASSFVVKSGSTRSNVIASNNVFYASGGRMDGAYAHWVEGDQTRLIRSNSAAALVLATPFSSAPTKGHTISLGRIPARWKSKAFFFLSPTFRRADGRYLHLFYEPKSSGTVRVRFYLDRSATAYNSYASDMDNGGGVTLDADDNFYEIDLTTTSGYARIPLPSSGAHVIEWEVEIVDSATSFEMTGFELDGFAEEIDGGP